MSVTWDPECVFCRSNPRRVWEEDGLAVCSDPAPLRQGHLLIYTTEHYPSAADMDAQAAERLDALEADLGKRICAEFGDYVLFEHGRTGHCLRSRPGERLCHHMHVHMIPGALDLRGYAGIAQEIGISSWRDVLALGSDVDGYVVIGNAHEKVVAPLTRSLPPHHLRTVIARANATPDLADWELALAGEEVGLVAAASHSTVVALVENFRFARAT